MSTETPRRIRSDGQRSRDTILRTAASLATVEGLEGLSIGNLAAHIGMSKSGLYAHFGSKEELQLATVDTAEEIFEAEVVAPTEQIADPLERLLALCDSFLDHLERRVFPGGCFFASVAAEFDMHPGPVRDKVAAVQSRVAGSPDAARRRRAEDRQLARRRGRGPARVRGRRVHGHGQQLLRAPRRPGATSSRHGSQSRGASSSQPRRES